MNSMTMHILGGLVDAAMNSTTFGCRSDVITRTSSWKLFSISLVIFSAAITFTATSVPFHTALCTSPYPPAPSCSPTSSSV
jgi:hypothetical protein